MGRLDPRARRPAPIMLTFPISIAVWCLRGAAGRVLMYLIIDSTPSYERWMNLQYILKFLKYIICIDYLTKTHNWVEWTAPSVSLLQTKINDINLNDRPQMQNDTENEIGRSLFPFIHGLRILISFDYLHQSHAVKIS